MNVARYDPNEVTPFYKRIAAHPADVLARLIFADWLEEHGEPWADYVRAEIALATDAPDAGERARLTTRATDLYWKHHRYWNGRVHRQWVGTPLAGRHARANGVTWRYRRGFPEVLDVRATFFTDHADLFLDAAPFRDVILRHPPHPLREFLTAHESTWDRLETVILAEHPSLLELRELSRLPVPLRQSIRVGPRAQSRLPGGAGGG